MLRYVLERIKDGMPKSRQYRSLMKSILMLGFLLPFIPMVLVGGLVFYQLDAAYKARVKSHLAETARKGALAINGFLSESVADLRFIAAFLDDQHLGEPGVLDGILRKSRMREGPVFETLVLLDPQGGEIAAARQGRSLGPYKAEPGWLKAVLDAGYGIRATGMPPPDIPRITIAVRGGAGATPRILLSDIDGRAFSDMLKRIRQGPAGPAFILSGEGGRLAAAPSGIDSNVAESSDLPGPSNGQADVVLFSGHDAAGHATIYAASRLGPAGWRLVVGERASDAYSDLNKAKKVTAGFILFAGAVIAVYAFGLSRKTVRRMELADKAKQKMNEQMLQTGKLASIGELAAGIAHEINNPVAIMVEEAGWIEDLLADEDIEGMKEPGELRRALKQIHSQGQRCKSITHQLLSFARKTDFRLQKVDLKNLIEEILTISSRHSKGDKVTIRLNVQEDLPEFLLPPTELQQVLLNLINNAVDAVEEDRGVVTIGARLDGEDILIEVSDNGKGIPEEDLTKIFDPFFTTKPVGKGTGLGLSICYGIVKRMEGDIRASSRPGGGTVFRVRIPATQNLEAPGGGAVNGPGGRKTADAVGNGR